MSFLKKLFGGGGAQKPVAIEQVEYKGCQIESVPMNEGGQFRVSAMIRKEIDGEVKEHRLIRADQCATLDEATEISMRKARQMIDEQGDRIFI